LNGDRGLFDLRIDLSDNQQTVQLVQITDTHLGSSQGEQLLGMDTDESLAHVVKCVARERSTADILLGTGDISNSGSVSSYQRFYDLTKALARHSLWLPGNHDSLEAMQSSKVNPPALSRSALIGHWQILMLNSTAKGKVGGSFSQAEFDFLQQSLAAGVAGQHHDKANHVLICLHHHPISIGCAWLDEQKVANADEFFSIIDQFDHVRGVLWGHIHQAIDRERNGVKMMATPSSCVQFAPNSRQFKLDRRNPGYRWLELHADGRIKTAISRVTGIDFNLDYENSTGY
jgi:3',5'-cyclic-AMP phosphodiesterase